MGFRMTKKSGNGEGFPQAPAGSHLARCVAVIDIGQQMRQFGDQPAAWVPEVVLAWELIDEQIPGQAGNFVVITKCRASLNEKATLAKLISSWRGKPLETDEVFDLQTLLNKPCMVNITHVPSKKDPSRIYSNVAGVSQLPKSMKAGPATVEDPFCWSVDEGAGWPDPDWLPYLMGEPVYEHIKRSKEFQAKVGAGMANDLADHMAGDDDDGPF